VGIPVTGGFMTGSASALEDSWRIVWRLEEDMNVQRFDPGILPPKWDQTLYDKKPKIGYFTSNQLLEAAPGCVRVVRETVERLEAAGYEVVRVQPPDIRDVLYYFNGIVLADKNQGMYNNLSYDLYDSSLNGLVMAMTAYKMPWILKKLFFNPLASLLSRVSPIEKLFSQTEELWEGLQQRDQFVRKYLQLLDSAGVDVLICPGQQLPAPPTGQLGTMMAGGLPYIPWNVMNFPAGIVPRPDIHAQGSLLLRGHLVLRSCFFGRLLDDHVADLEDFDRGRIMLRIRERLEHPWDHRCSKDLEVLRLGI